MAVILRGDVNMNIVRARPEEADTLTRLAFAAKRHWGYPETWIAQWSAELTVTPSTLAARPTFLARVDDAIAGFYVLQLAAHEAGLEHLWVAPAAMGQGVGRALFEHATEFARQHRAARLTIISDPHAAGFYERMGATSCGRHAAPMDGQQRFLPLLEKAL